MALDAGLDGTFKLKDYKKDLFFKKWQIDLEIAKIKNHITKLLKKEGFYINKLEKIMPKMTVYNFLNLTKRYGYSEIIIIEEIFLEEMTEILKVMS